VNVTGAKSFLAASLVSASFLTNATAWAADVWVAPAGARVGIIVMLPTDITHYHVGKAPTGSFLRTYRVEWPVSEVVDNQLAATLKSAGLEPVFLEPTEELHRQRQKWIVSTRFGTKLLKPAQDEVDRIIAAGNLQGLIIVAPGLNTNPDSALGNRLRKLPGYVQGWGFSTSDEPGGATKPVVFNLTQMLLIGKEGDTSQLVFREWGGGFVYEWSDFEPGADLKKLPQSEIDKFRPLILDVIQRQIARLMPRVKVSG
jgi:hypothetical protein